MSLAGIIGILIVCATLLLNLLLLAGIRRRASSSGKSTVESLPVVAVLVAARNEEDTLPRCLDALLNLDYPRDKLRIWVGDDNSTDNTALILRKYAQKHPQIRKVFVTERIGNSYGKANVLAHLGREASADYFFFTDADTAVPSGWIKAMLPYFQDQTGMTVGTTLVQETSLCGALQCTDWALAQAMLKVVSDTFEPVTGMGNNMAMPVKVYREVGGFERLPPSIVEDFEMFRAVKKKGYAVEQLVLPAVTAETLPVSRISTLLHQRKRWMVGAGKIHWFLRILLVIQAAYYPALVTLLIANPIEGIFVACSKTVLQAEFIRRFLSRVERKSNIISLLTFEFYSATLSLVLIFFYFLPIKIRWKNRTY
ncbi:glycosyltransferase [Roseivirga sp. BDSF3-8]|uniref:glycosyltransferase n=1 Tax=Roseivirga sp. BDSF3-8 TaxID=3241598 RepID=UPI0035319CEA